MIKVRLKGNLLKEAQAAFAIAAAKKRVEAVTKLRDETPIDTGEARDGWRIDENGNIVNDVEHITPLNDGHSQQAPAFFIEKTLLSLRGIRPRGTIVRPK
jgi:hypothetical protein